MRRYLKIIWLFCKMSFITQLEFRAAFTLLFIGNVLWMTLELAFVQLIFGQIKSLAGWSKNEVIILVLVFEFFTSLTWWFIIPSLATFYKLVDKGDLDLVLTKPVSSRLWISTRSFEFDVVSRVVVLLPLTVYILVNTGFTPNFTDIGNFILAMVASVIVCYNFFFAIAVTNIWFVKIFNLVDLYDSINNMARFPADVFKGVSRVIFAYVIPSAFIASIPTSFLIGRGSTSLLIFTIMFAVATSVVSQAFWNFALKHYSSASS